MSASGLSSVEYRRSSSCPANRDLNHTRSTLAMCLTRPSSDKFDGGTDGSASCSPERPAHLASIVSRYQSRQASSAPLSVGTKDTSARVIGGAIQVTEA